jgi:hypothetical protein
VRMTTKKRTKQQNKETKREHKTFQHKFHTRNDKAKILTLHIHPIPYLPLELSNGLVRRVLPYYDGPSQRTLHVGPEETDVRALDHV